MMSARTPITVRVSRRFDEPAERVFDAWLNRAMIGRWMFGPDVRDEEVVRLSIDPRVGGGFCFVVERDGEEIEHLGKYLEIERPRRLVFTWVVVGERAGSRVLLEIVSGGEECELTLTHELHPDWAQLVEPLEASWQHMLNALAFTLKQSR
jgi:uncharacterized protein YndB with AHSA1/START domain